VPRDTNEHFGAEETRRRMAAALRGAFNTPHKQMKDIPSKRTKKARTKKKKSRSSSA
jgi:hypothetical protein